MALNQLYRYSIILSLQYYGGGNDPAASLAQKIFIPLALLVGAGISIPLGLPDLFTYSNIDHHCTDWFRVKKFWLKLSNGTDTATPEFHSDLYATVVAAFTYIIPVHSRILIHNDDTNYIFKCRYLIDIIVLFFNFRC